MKLKLILAALAIAATVGVASAQTTDTKTVARKSCYVDADKNGICDKNEAGTCKTGNGKGMRNGQGKGNGARCGQGLRNGSGNGNGGRGANFVDANSNGICDIKETEKK